MVADKDDQQTAEMEEHPTIGSNYSIVPTGREVHLT